MEKASEKVLRSKSGKERERKLGHKCGLTKEWRKEIRGEKQNDAQCRKINMSPYMLVCECVSECIFLHYLYILSFRIRRH